MYKSKIESFIPKMIKMYQEGKSCEYISQIIGCSKATIRYQLKNHGIKLRDRKGLIHSINSRRKILLEDFKNFEGTPNFDYFLGILATDGCIYKNSVRIEQSDENIEILQNYCSFLKNKVFIRKSTHHSKNYNQVSFKNQEICDYLSSFGITPKKSFSLYLKYINWDILRGVFDGDGCLTYDSRKNGSWRFSITSASDIFIQQISNFLQLYDLHPLVYKEGNYYTIHIGKLSEIYFIFQHLYKDSSYFLKRKYEKFCPLVEKFTRQDSVNSVKGRENHKTEPSSYREGAETLNGTPAEI